MLFSEIYGVYYAVTASILSEAARGALTGRRVTELVRERAFGESGLTIPEALRSGAWPLLDASGGTPIRHPPTMPLTTLQRRWLKALLLDPRIALFSPGAEGLEDVEPLYRPEVIVPFDQYDDGDPYGDEHYIACFRLILQALHQRRQLRVRFRGRTGARHTLVCCPVRLEYSAKDDKFRLLTASEDGEPLFINLARIRSCELLEPCADAPEPALTTRRLTFLLRDERGALERAMLHFSDLEKVTVRLEEALYQVTLSYAPADEAELLIRILSFGPMIQVTSPEDFIRRLRDRLAAQQRLLP